MRRELPRNPQRSFVFFSFPAPIIPAPKYSQQVCAIACYFIIFPKNGVAVATIAGTYHPCLPSVMTLQPYLTLGELCRVERRVVEEHEPVASQSMLLPVVIQQDQKLQHATLSDRRAGEGRRGVCPMRIAS